MRNKIIALLLVMLISTPVFAQTVGSVNYRQLITNYSKAKTAMSELEDKTNELQRYLLDKEKEFKKIDSAVQKKNFEDQTARAFAQKQDALEKYRQKKEEEHSPAIIPATAKEIPKRVPPAAPRQKIRHTALILTICSRSCESAGMPVLFLP